MQNAQGNTTIELKKYLQKNNTYEIEFPNARGVVNDLYYQVKIVAKLKTYKNVYLVQIPIFPLHPIG